jgi:hypothetical protein
VKRSGVYTERRTEILRYAQNDRERSAQNDRERPGGEGRVRGTFGAMTYCVENRNKGGFDTQ